MARRHYEFGTTPYEEDCVQVSLGKVSLGKVSIGKVSTLPF